MESVVCEGRARVETNEALTAEDLCETVRLPKAERGYMVIGNYLAEVGGTQGKRGRGGASKGQLNRSGGNHDSSTIAYGTVISTGGGIRGEKGRKKERKGETKFNEWRAREKERQKWGGGRHK